MVRSALCERDEIADDHGAQVEDGAPANPLNGYQAKSALRPPHFGNKSKRRTTSCDEPTHVLRRPGECAADEEHRDGNEHDRPTPEDVREARGEREDRGACQTVGGSDPHKVVLAVEVVGHRRDGDGDGDKVQRAEEVGDHDCDEGEPEGRPLA